MKLLAISLSALAGVAIIAAITMAYAYIFGAGEPWWFAAWLTAFVALGLGSAAAFAWVEAGS